MAGRKKCVIHFRGRGPAISTYFQAVDWRSRDTVPGLSPE